MGGAAGAGRGAGTLASDSSVGGCLGGGSALFCRSIDQAPVSNATSTISALAAAP